MLPLGHGVHVMAMVAHRSKLDPDLGRWLCDAPPDARRTVIVRLGSAGDPSRAAQRLKEIGADVQEVGHAVLVVRVTPALLRRVEDLAWVLSVDVPQKLGLA